MERAGGTGTAVAEAPKKVAVDFKKLQEYARMKLVEGRQLTPDEAADVSKLLTSMWRLQTEYPRLIADLVRAVLKPVLHPAEQRKACDCSSCEESKKGG